LHLLTQLRPRFDLTLHAAHLDHQLREGESAADADFVRRIAANWKVPLIIETLDIAAIAAERKKGIEETARQERYTFLARVAGQIGVTKVAVGHNADDQAETVLMHLLRGTGLAGLRGMAPSAPFPLPSPGLTLIRPLLSVPRSAIDAYLAEQDLVPRLDHSNLDPTYLRNRLRHQLLPLMEEISPRISLRLGQLAELAAADLDLLEEALDEVWETVSIDGPGRGVALDRAAWCTLPLGLRRRALRRALTQLSGSLEGITFSHLEAARRLAEVGSPGAQATLPRGVRLLVGDGRLLLTDDPQPERLSLEWPHMGSDDPVTLAVPGRTRLPGTGWAVEIRTFYNSPELRQGIERNQDEWCAYLDAGSIGTTLVLRPRRRGERFQPLGMRGRSSSISDFMINRRIPQGWRDRVPILATGDRSERILWIAGWQIDERAKVTEQTAEVLRISFQHAGRE
jgi:tRNA(Ile)-lysidine synthase